MQTTTIYTDGSYFQQTDSGGWGIVVKQGRKRRVFSGQVSCTSSTQAELVAIIEGMKTVKKPSKINIFTDCQSIVFFINNNYKKWATQGYHKQKNRSLWQALLDQMSLHNVNFHWVPGHADNKDNQVCHDNAITEAKKLNSKKLRKARKARLDARLAKLAG